MIFSVSSALSRFYKHVYDERLVPRANFVLAWALVPSAALCMLFFKPSNQAVACYLYSAFTVYAVLQFLDPRVPFKS